MAQSEKHEGYAIKCSFSHTTVYNDRAFFYKDRNVLEKVFVDGLMAKKPHANAPEWVKCNINIKREELLAWLSAQSEDWINLQVCESKRGKWYAEVDTWKPDTDTRSMTF